jgi:hypothetical protein
MIDPQLEQFLKEHIRLERATVQLLSEIKFELQNARKLKVEPKKKSLWVRIKEFFS